MTYSIEELRIRVELDDFADYSYLERDEEGYLRGGAVLRPRIYAPNGNTEGTMNELVMLRVAKAQILNRKAYEYFAGRRSDGSVSPGWRSPDTMLSTSCANATACAPRWTWSGRRCG